MPGPFDQLSLVICGDSKIDFTPALRRQCRLRKGTIFKLTGDESLNCRMSFSGPGDVCIHTPERVIYASIDGGNIVNVRRRAWVFEAGPLRQIVGDLESMVGRMATNRAQGHAAGFTCAELNLTTRERAALLRTMLHFRFDGDERHTFAMQVNTLVHIPENAKNDVTRWRVYDYKTPEAREEWCNEALTKLVFSIRSDA